MTNTELLAALKALPVANSKTIRTMLTETLNELRDECYEAENRHSRERFEYIYAAAGGEEEYEKLGWMNPKQDHALKTGNAQYAAGHPEWPELEGLIKTIRYAVIDRELRRRGAAAAKKRNAAKREANAIAAGTYAVGDKVQVHAMGYWYDGEVVKLGRTGKVTVRYTSGSGVTREKAVGQDKVRK